MRYELIGKRSKISRKSAYEKVLPQNTLKISQWRIQGGANPATAPPLKLAMEFGPPREQKQ